MHLTLKVKLRLTADSKPDWAALLHMYHQIFRHPRPHIGYPSRSSGINSGPGGNQTGNAGWSGAGAASRDYSAEGAEEKLLRTPRRHPDGRARSGNWQVWWGRTGGSSNRSLSVGLRSHPITLAAPGEKGDFPWTGRVGW